MTDGGALMRRLPSLSRKTTSMLLKRIKAAVLAALLGVASLSPAFAISIDPNKTIPARQAPTAQVNYMRATVNYNDRSISSGVWAFTLPANAYIMSIDAYVTTAFNAGTTNTVTVGATTTANEIVASGITAGSTGVYHLTSAAGLGLAVTGNSTYQTQANSAIPVYFKYAQTGTAATAGAVTIVITYVPNNDQ